MKTLQQAIEDASIIDAFPDYAGNDCLKIQAAAIVFDLSLTLKECHDIWQEWSDERSAQWLNISSIDEIKQSIQSFIEKRRDHYADR